MRRDSILNTLVVTITLSLVCSVLVSGAAILLRDRQQQNAEVFRKKNVLEAAGVTPEAVKEAGGVQAYFDAYVQDLIVNLETGKVDPEGLAAAMNLPLEEALAKYEPIKAAKSARGESKLATAFQRKSEDVAGLGAGRENFARVYRYNPPEGEGPIWVFPVRGRGLWSTLKGFIALQSDFQTIAGLTFYEHAETPGLGGEVDNPGWKKLWIGKKVYGDEGEVEIRVVKGDADASNPYGVDGLSGATITSNGVTNLLEYWLGPKGFGPFIAQQKEAGSEGLASPPLRSHGISSAAS